MKTKHIHSPVRGELVPLRMLSFYPLFTPSFGVGKCLSKYIALFMYLFNPLFGGSYDIYEMQIFLLI